MNYAIVENGVVVNIAVAYQALAPNWVQSDTAAIGDLYSNGVFTKPDPVVAVPDQVTALQGLLAIDAAGLSSAYQAWAADPARTFSEKAFIDKAIHWKRNDPVLLLGANALGLNSAQLDQLFIAASAL